MKTTHLFSDMIIQKIHKDRKKYFALVLIFIFGTILGSLHLSVSKNNTETQTAIKNFISAYSLHGVVRKDVFLLSFSNYLKLLAFLWISGWHPLLLPIGFVQIFMKGFRIGFTVSCFITYYHLKGVLFAALTTLPQNLLFLPALFYFSVYQIHFASVRKSFQIEKANFPLQKETYIKNFFLLLIFMSVISLCSVIEGYITPTFIHPFCQFFK